MRADLALPIYQNFDFILILQISIDKLKVQEKKMLNSTDMTWIK